MSKYVTPEYLLTHGFVQYNSQKEGDVYQIPFDNEHALHFREIEFDRNMFVVVLRPDGDSYDHTIHVQINAGCGFTEIPELWSELAIEQFEAIYFGIRGKKPNDPE